MNEFLRNRRVFRKTRRRRQRQEPTKQWKSFKNRNKLNMRS